MQGRTAAIWAIAEIDPALIGGTIDRVNIALSRRILTLLDQWAKSAGETRSGHIAQVTLTR